MTIKVLPAEISNQIAAGEVVERPASVVKECIENALDAGATDIEIYLNNGGKTLIKIVDNGKGMDAEDLPRAVLRHATSKISSTEDLFHLQQYGFRGEALAAVSSISDFSLLSRTASSDDAYQLVGNAGKFSPITPSAGNLGTTVEITELFKPTPARLEYLKSDDAEHRACVKEIYGFALGNPDVSFCVYKNDKKTLDYPACDFKSRVGQVLKKLSDDLCPVDFDRPNLKVNGFISAPGQGLSHRNQQYLLVNGRRIEDHRLAFAVREAYVQTCGIEKHLHPAYVLSLTIDPILVDVNVHPRKLEVKFAEPGEVFGAVKAAAMEGLKNMSYNNQPSNAAAFTPSALEASFIPTPKAKPFASQPRHSTQSFSQQLNQRQQNFTLHSSPATQLEANHLPLPTGQQPISLIGQADNKYIVAQSADGLYFFDQHALHERQRFEDFWQAYKAAPVKGQPLLVPDVLNLTENEVSLLHENNKTLIALGFKCEFPADDQLVINEVPELIVGQNLERIMRLCIKFLESEKLGEHMLDAIMRKLLEYKSCRGAVMFGDKLEREEMEKLIADFDKTDWKLLCPHGRPNHHFVSFAELDKKFHR